MASAPEQPEDDGVTVSAVEQIETGPADQELADQAGEAAVEAAESPEPVTEPLPPLDDPSEPEFGASTALGRSLWGEIVPAAVLALLAAAWIATVAIALFDGAGGPGGLLRIATWIGVGAAPLALLAVAWLIVAHSGRGESRRYARTARAMRADSANLVGVLGIVTRRLEESRALIEAQADMLDRLGHGAAGRFTAASEAIRRDAGEFQRLTGLLEGSSSVARHDIRALLGELPTADDHARRIAATLRTAGAVAQEHVETLEQRLMALAEAAHAADLQVNSSADRLTTQLSHLAGTGAQTVRRIEEVSHGLEGTIGQSLETAGKAIDATRQGVTEQAHALAALAEQARSALERAGADQAATLGRRLDEITTRIDGFVNRLAGQDAGSLELVTALEAAIGRIEERFTALGANGAEQATTLTESLTGLMEHAEHVARSLGGGTVAAGTLLDRVSTVRRVLDSNARDLEDTIPASLSRLRLHAERSLASVNAATPHAETLAALAESTSIRLADIAASVEAQNQAVNALGADVDRRLASTREQAHVLNRLILEIGQGAEGVATGSASRLVDAMNRVRETAAAASEQARTALAALVPALAEDLGSTIESTVDKVLAERTRAHIEGIAAVADETMSAADRAAEFLRQHVVGIDKAAQAMEGRVMEVSRASADEIANRVTAVHRAAESMEQRLIEAGRQSSQQIAERVAEIARATETMEDQLGAARQASAQEIAARVAAVDAAAAAMEERMREAGRLSLEHIASRIEAVAGATDSMEQRVTGAGASTTERLASQIAEVTRVADQMEARVAEAREAAEKQDNHSFSRQVALLVESLNSSAIDVAKILSNDITDTAWAAYLRGDRGVFTRRAVRLLDNSETREILRIYSAEPEFREQVNRYVHDFEAMLRRVLSSRDGGPLGVTMLSSDMGKLYVALAQAIERLRV